MKSAWLSAAAAAALLLAAPAAAQPRISLETITAPSGTYVLDDTHASVTFRVMHLGLSAYTARFTRFASEVQYDAADPAKSQLTVTIDPRSIETDYPFPDKEDFDKKLGEGDDWLAGGKHPEMRFVSRSIRRTGASSGELVGDLTMRGVTRPVTLQATWNGAITHPFRKIPVFGVSARGKIKRSDWGMTANIPFVADEVELVIEAEYMRK